MIIKKELIKREIKAAHNSMYKTFGGLVLT